MQQMQQMVPKADAMPAPAPKCDNVMIDLETLGVTADAMIMSIGAVKFTMDGYIDDKGFYAICSMNGQLMRHINPDTLVWWMKQDAVAQSIFSDEGRIMLEDALHDLKEWYRGSEKALLWSNGADFDIPMVNHALRMYDIDPLTQHWNHRCFRTLKNEWPMVAKPPHEGTAHNALVDAIQQAKWAQAIAEFKRGVKPPAMPKGFAAAR
jgi:DNA polymerase III epsilon subunit-like protein